MFLRKQRPKGKEEVSSPGGDPCPQSAAGGAGLAGGGPVAPHTLGFGAGCRLRLCAGGSLRQSRVEREAELSVRALWWHLPAQGGLSLPYAGSKGNAELQMLFALSHGSSRSHLPHSEGRSA